MASHRPCSYRTLGIRALVALAAVSMAAGKTEASKPEGGIQRVGCSATLRLAWRKCAQKPCSKACEEALSGDTMRCDESEPHTVGERRQFYAHAHKMRLRAKVREGRGGLEVEVRDQQPLARR